MPHVSAKSNEPSIVITSSILGFAPVAIRTPGKIDKEKARSRDLEKVKKEQEIVIESLSEEYQGVTSRCQRLQQQIYDGDQSSRRGSESGSGEDRRGRSEGASRREGRRAAREDELQGEIDDLLDERNSHEDEYRAWEEEKEALTRKADEGEDAFRKIKMPMPSLPSSPSRAPPPASSPSPRPRARRARPPKRTPPRDRSRRPPSRPRGSSS